MISAQSGGGSGPTLTPPPSKPGSAAAAAAPVAPDVFSNQLKQAGKALDLEMGRDRQRRTKVRGTTGGYEAD